MSPRQVELVESYIKSDITGVGDPKIKEEFLTILNEVVAGGGQGNAPDCNPQTPRNTGPWAPPADQHTQVYVNSDSSLHTMVCPANEFLLVHTSYTLNVSRSVM